MPAKNAYIVIIDPVSSGSVLAPIAHKRGYGVVSVETTKYYPILAQNSLRPENFDLRIQYEDPELLARELKSLPIAGSIIGFEGGIRKGAELHASLKKHGIPVVVNSPEYAETWVHKGAAQRAFKEAKMRSIPTLETSMLSEALAWARSAGYPIVVKPPSSAGSDLVFVCENEAELRRGFSKILTQADVFGVLNQTVIVQKDLIDPEGKNQLYIVDLVARDGVNRIVWVKKYHLHRVPGHGYVFDKVELLPLEGEDQKLVVDYAHDMTRALHIDHGAAHFEIFVTEDRLGKRSAVGLDAAARLAGGASRNIVLRATGQDVAEILLDALTDKEKFLAEADQHYKFTKGAWILGISNPHSRAHMGDAATIQARLESLPSFAGYTQIHPSGSGLYKTKDLSSMLGLIQLVHEDPAQLARDEAAIRAWEAELLFYTPVTD